MAQSINHDRSKLRDSRITLHSHAAGVGFHRRHHAAANRRCPALERFAYRRPANVTVPPRRTHFAAARRHERVGRTNHIHRRHWACWPWIGIAAIPCHRCDGGDPQGQVRGSAESHARAVRETGDVHTLRINVGSSSHVIEHSREKGNIIRCGWNTCWPRRAVVPAERIREELRRLLRVRRQTFGKCQCESRHAREPGPACFFICPLRRTSCAVQEYDERERPCGRLWYEQGIAPLAVGCREGDAFHRFLRGACGGYLRPCCLASRSFSFPSL